MKPDGARYGTVPQWSMSGWISSLLKSGSWVEVSPSEWILVLVGNCSSVYIDKPEAKKNRLANVDQNQ